MYAVIKYRVALDVQYLIKYADRSPYIYMNHEFHDRIGDGVVGGYRKIASSAYHVRYLKALSCIRTTGLSRSNPSRAALGSNAMQMNTILICGAQIGEILSDAASQQAALAELASPAVPFVLAYGGLAGRSIASCSEASLARASR